MRKILNNYNKSKRYNGFTEGKIGTLLNIVDKNDNFIYVGDTLKYNKYEGVILYNPAYRQYGIALDYSMWYGTDKYNIDSYGKFISVPMDNGAKMEIEKISGI